MSVSSYDAVAEKVLVDLDSAIKKDPSIDRFYVIPTLEENNKNSSPILKGENTLGLESWIIPHIYPYAHHQMMQKQNYKAQHLNKLIPCLTGVALLNPEMAAVWNKRKELILSKKMMPDDELRLTRLALSRKPKCNDVLFHRKWLIMEILKDVEDQTSLLLEELRLSESIANDYHSNYHAWNHRMWALQNLLPDHGFLILRKRYSSLSFFSNLQADSDLIHHPISKLQFSHLNAWKISEIYFEELENNFKWISSHVSDHSGLHFRTFLISEILMLVKVFFDASNKINFQSDCNYRNSHNSIAHMLIRNGKKNLCEFLCCPLNNSLKNSVDDYLLKLEDEVTLLDIALFLIVTELKSNCSLSLLFSNHEALCYYRRFLVHSYKMIMNAVGFRKTNASQKIFVHQDKYGVPYRKDFKYDDSTDYVTKHKNLYLALNMRIIESEKNFISKMNSIPDSHENLMKNYSRWLQKCLQEDCDFV